MKFFFLGKLLTYLGRRLDGKKTYAGAAGKVLAGLATMLGGVVGLLGYMFPDQGLPNIDPELAWGTTCAGLYAISSGLQGVGLGHKMEKLRHDQIDQTAPETFEQNVGN